MEPLKIYRKTFEIICCCSFDNETNKWILRRNKLISAILLILLLFMCTSSAVYFFEIVHENFVESLYAVFQVCATFAMFYTLCIGLLLRNNLTDFFLKIQKFYDDCK